MSDPSPETHEPIRQFGPSTGEKADEGWFRAVANCTYDWESWHDPGGGIVWVNSSVERFTGYSPAECLAMTDYPLPLTAPRHRARISQMLEEAKRGSARNDLEFETLHRDGSARWMAVSWQPMYTEQGVYLGFRTSVRDVTQRREMRDELRRHAEHLEQLVQERTARIHKLERQRRQMEKAAALGQLAAGVAHEINNPLAGIRNAFELIKTDLTPESESFGLVELVDREIERIASIVHQMYQLYRRSPQTPIEFEIDQMVAEVVWMLNSVARKFQVELDTTRPSGAYTYVFLPEGEVKQVLYNLIRNAIQASSAGDRVTIEIAAAEEDIRIVVSDNGEGIAAESLPRLFDPFFTTKSDQPGMGMGLGLSVSRSLVEAMGGTIEVETAVGEGSRFIVTFPRRIMPMVVESHE